MAMELLEKLATNLGLAVDHLWPVLIYQAQMYGQVLLGVGALFLPATVVLWSMSYRESKKEYSSEDAIFTYALLGAVCCATTLIAATSGLMRLLNPDFYALRYILNAGS